MAKTKTIMRRTIHESYRDLLKTEQWMRFSSAVKSERGNRCWICDCSNHDETLEVHHMGYKEGAKPWEYNLDEVLVVCSTCHRNIHDFADDLWNEALKTDNQWLIYECYKAVRRIIAREKGVPEQF